ncbi:type I secretion system permease/ATPase [Kistimonas scapharcae]|uniref:Type I secretion system permease/ATPase n=1 Tax=Kistimonas scapharcae TaxID=1036133 RepID=A0ABP8V890_9GAMM
MLKFTLKESFLAICHYLGADVVKEDIDALTREGQDFDLRSLERAARYCGLSAVKSRRKLIDLSEDDLPCIVQLKKKHFMIITDFREGECFVASGRHNKGIWMPLERLDAVYSGVIYRFQEGSAEQQKNRSLMPAWFRSQMTELWPHYAQVLLATVMVNLLTLALPLFTNMVFDKLIPTFATDTLLTLSIGMVGVVVFDFILRWLRSYFVDDACRIIEKRSEQFILARLIQLKQSALPDSPGRITHAVENFARVKEFLSGTVLLSLLDVPFFILFTLVIALIAGVMALIPLGIALCLIPVTIYSYRRTRRHASQLTQANNAKTAYLYEISSELEAIKTLGARRKALARWRSLVTNSAGASLSSKQSNVLLNTLVTSATQCVVIGMLVLGVFQIHNGNISPGTLFACIILGSRAIAPLMNLAMAVNRLSFSIKALKEINELLGLTGEDDSSDKLNVPTLKGHIEFDKVSYRFSSSEPEVLRDINFTIKPGERVAILGASGSGKSTLVRLIQGLAEPTEGNILVDGHNLNHLNLDQYRSHCAVAPQKPSLFRGTLKSNLMLGKSSATTEQLDEACHAACLDGFVRQCSKGYSHPIQERGSNLSGGQKQSLCLARALLRHGRLLMLDEPTSAYDNYSETLFCQRLPNMLKENQTLILITHRHNLLQLVDRIIVMAEGRIIADGSRNRVLAELTQRPAASTM